MYNATSRLSSRRRFALLVPTTLHDEEREREMIIVRELGVRMVCDMIMYDLKVYTDDGVRGVFFYVFSSSREKDQNKTNFVDVNASTHTHTHSLSLCLSLYMCVMRACMYGHTII